MIHTTFRVKVTTAQPEEEELLDTATLLSVFKCASATHDVAPNFGLPACEEGEAADRDDGAADDALLQTARAIDSAHAALADAKGKARAIGIPNRQGRLITPEALDIYRETFVMRRSFGIPNTQRANVDTTSKKLPKILPEDVSRYFPTPSAEQLAQAMTKQPKTKAQLADAVLTRFPQVLPALSMRISVLHRPLWERDDEVARHNWKKVVRPQLAECLHELQKDLLRLEVPSNVGKNVKDALRFSRLDLRFDKYIVSIANEGVNRIGNVDEVLDTFYGLLNSGAFGQQEVVRIDAPFVDFDAVRKQNEICKARYLEAAEQAEREAEEAARAQTEREEQWARDAAQAQEAISAAEQLAREEAANSKFDDAATGAEADIAAVGEPAGEGASTVEGEHAGNAPGTEADAATDAAAETPSEEEPNHYQGAAALHFSEQTVWESHRIEWENVQRRAALEAQREQEREKAAEAGGVWMPELRQRVWGVLFADGTYAYLDSATGTFCEAPAPDDQAADPAADQAPEGEQDAATEESKETLYA